jgi:histidyl-tRNA synthetase
MDTEKTKTQEPLQTVRGMQDFLPDRSGLVSEIEAQARAIFGRFGYREIRTPVMESAALFQRAIGEATDIVEKEMFSLKDRGDRLLCLRPEGTAGVVRSYIENSLGKKQSVNKLFYIGPMFRAERPQAGRFRQFVQIGSEYFGSAAPAADAETIVLVGRILAASGASSYEAHLNSLGCPECRPAYTQNLLQFLRGIESRLCEDCKRRIGKNPLRVLDCKVDPDKLAGAPNPLESLCGACREHHGQVKKLLSAVKLPFREVPQMVRGLDYYTRTVFEFYATGKTGSQDALAAGGRYDRLVEDLGGDPTPAVGFALGLERVLALAQEQRAAQTPARDPRQAFVVALGESATEKAFELLDLLRSAGWSADAALGGQSMKSQMRMADSLGARYCLILGDNELRDGTVAVKDLEQKSQEMVPMDRLIETLNGKTK